MRLTKTTQSIVIVLTFLLAFYGFRLMNTYFPLDIPNDYVRTLVFYAWWLVPTVFLTGILYGFKGLGKHFGLHKGFVFGFAFGLVTVLPMLVSSAIIGRISDDFNLFALLKGTVFAGFGEEVLFRGFLFGLLFRKASWGFIPAALLGAVLFGMGHLYQGSNLMQTLGIFFVTAIGAAWFAWLYIEWNNNLWVPIFLHILMNLSWTLFEVSDTALGGITTNIFRVITIALTIVITLRHNKKAGYAISKNNLIRNQEIAG